MQLLENVKLHIWLALLLMGFFVQCLAKCFLILFLPPGQTETPFLESCVETM